MSRIDRNLKGNLSEQDKTDLNALLDWVDKTGTPLNIKVTRRGPTNGGKSSRLELKIEAQTTEAPLKKATAASPKKKTAPKAK
jgi:hypothetical protein